MLDRQDIDALLMGALYGELSPSESTRLDEHLSAHPQDKLVLDGLTRARQALRDSHVLALHAEPPAAVSALLLQEAARRAPQAREERVGFFARLAALLRHPATAAAAVVVLIAGVAGTLYLKGGAVADQERHVTVGVAPPSSDNTGTAPEAGSAAAAVADEEQGFEGDYRADLAEDGKPAVIGGLTGNGSADGNGARDGKLEVPARPATKDTGAAAPATEPAKNEAAFERDRGGDADGAKDAEKPRDEQRNLKKKGKGYIEVTTPDPEPKTLDEDSYKFASPDDDVSGGAPSKRQITGAKPGQTTPADPAAAAPPATASRGSGGESLATPDTTAPSTDDLRSYNSSSGAPGVAQTDKADKTATATATAKGRVARNDQAAKVAHAKLVALVKSNKCNDAAKAAGQLYATYPDYYAEFVANDRQIKACKAYIDTDRKRRNEAAKSRSKVTNEVEAPSPAAADSK